MERSPGDQPEPAPIFLPEGYHANEATIRKALQDLETVEPEVVNRRQSGRPRSGEISISQIDPRVMAVARVLANNEMDRVVFRRAEGSATVYNSPGLARAAKYNRRKR
jgi:hypothetical protein